MARKTKKPRKKYVRKYARNPMGIRDPWPLEGEILAFLAGLANDVVTVRGLDTLIPWLMLVHRIATRRKNHAMVAVADGMLRTAHEIYDRRILLPTIVTPQDLHAQQLYVTAVQRESLRSVLPTLVDFVKRARNTEITQASTELMEEHA